MKITRAVELRSSKFWMFWKATNLLFHLSTTFMGVGARYPVAPSANKKYLIFFQICAGGTPAYSLESHLVTIILENTFEPPLRYKI